MGDYDDDKKEDSGGSVWTSYSDMFITIAIVFLVMFVFTLLKSTAQELKSKLEQQQLKKKMEAKIPVEEHKKNQENLRRMEDSIENIQKKKELIAEKVEELNDLNKDLKDQKTVYTAILNTQKEQDAIIAESRLTIENLQIELKQRDNLKKDALDAKVQKDQLLKKIKNLVVRRKKLRPYHRTHSAKTKPTHRHENPQRRTRERVGES